ncbi:hypothetical protein DM01DRAFT_1348799 [Hesseltinella vesiculosa]|uniref:PB1 domain-containing protein n=1 Tax=Hesseltinella vesiculosa TaxID=101127 RepID=A0A1X2G7I0_9FUNG|nr:hypothetical protein DM01DRAFT_1348799 [Hesseltinella vesiculosa]
MALKLELEQWQSGCSAFDGKDYDSALRTFINMADSAKMHFNIGLIFAAVDDHERALAAYSRSISLDPYFAVAYFQKGVSHFCLGSMEDAKREFDTAHKNLRNNQIVNYQQLGLAFRLYACEVLFNRGICRLYLGEIDPGLTDLYHAQKSKMTEEHDVIDQAVRDRGKGYSVFSIPVGVLYRPPESKLHQLGNVDMFAAVNKLGLNKPPLQKPIHSSLGRNNSVLMGPRFQRKQSLGYSSMASRKQPTPQQPLPINTNAYPSSAPALSISTQKPNFNGSSNHIPLSSSSSSSSSLYHYRSPTTDRPPPPLPLPEDLPPALPMHTSHSSGYPPSPNHAHPHHGFPDPVPTHHYPHHSTSSSSSSTHARYRQDPRRVDSGFEFSADERYSSSSSRNSAKSQAYQISNMPPVPPMPRFDDTFDPVAAYGDITNDFQTMTVDDDRDRMRSRLNSNAHLDSEHLPARRSSAHSSKSQLDHHLQQHQQHPMPHPSTSSSTVHSLNNGTMAGHRLKIKVHHIDTRVILVPSNISFDDLFQRIREKLNAPPHTRLQYKDEENEMVLMIDDDDLQLARQIHNLRNQNEQGVEKLEIWCLS